MPTGLKVKHLFLGLGMALLFGGCSAASVPGATSNVQGATFAASQQGPASLDACKLLTQAEVEAAFGKTMLAPVATVEHGDSTCTYTNQSGGLDLTMSVSSRPSSAAAIKAAQALYGANVGVAGVGDAAFEVAGILEFVKGTTLVTIGTGDGPAIISAAKFQALAATAAGRI